jgi:hypothetical protein
MLLEMLSEVEVSRAWLTRPLDDLEPDLSLLRRCAQVLAAMSRGEPEILGSLDPIVPSNSHDAEPFGAAAKFLVLNPGPEAYLYDLLGWRLAKQQDPATEWSMLWRRALPLRVMERHRYGTGVARPDAGSVTKVVWAIGLHASWWLHGDGASAQETSLLTGLSDASLEQTLTRYVSDPFWDAASAHAVVALARIQPTAAALPNLSRAIEARASATPLFFRILHSLIDRVSPDVVWDSIGGGRGRVRELLAEARAIGAIDQHYLQQVSGSLLAIEGALSSG